MWDARDLIVSTSGEADGNALLQSLDRAKYEATPAQLAARLDKAAAAFRACFQLLGDRAEMGGVRYREWKDARQVLAEIAPDEAPDLLERFWKAFEAREDKRERQAERERQREAEATRRRAAGGLANVLGAGFSDSFGAAFRTPSTDYDVLLAASTTRAGAFTPARVPSRKQLAREVEDARTDVAQLHAAVAGTSVPADLRWGLAVLAAFAVVSVVLPVVLIALDVRVTPWWRSSVTGLFVVGLLALICYIGLTLRTAAGKTFLPWRSS